MSVCVRVWVCDSLSESDCSLCNYVNICVCLCFMWMFVLYVNVWVCVVNVWVCVYETSMNMWEFCMWMCVFVLQKKILHDVIVVCAAAVG